jgi:PBP1b-binding outer membrane lipoprotein LpoB
MKKISRAIIATLFIAACNNNADSDKSNPNPIDADSFNTSEKKDLNNRNTSVYDSAQHPGDTSSYERMPNKVKDSVPH